jgi:hydroxymethylpyrimidine/phosphomethylpyrimidine kinase
LAPVHAAGIPIVMDPVLSSTTAYSLAVPELLAVLRERLAPLATVLTPNLAEAAALAGVTVDEEGELRVAAAALLALGPTWVLLKGGHLPGDAVDLLTDGTDEHYLRAPRLTNPNSHGTGCALASAIATGLAGGLPVPAAVQAAKDYVFGAIAAGFPAGAGRGPVNHAWRIGATAPRPAEPV